jgi:hypothetical protein
MTNYRLTDQQSNGFDVIELTSDPFSGILYTYGGVQLIEEDDTLRVKFDYDVILDNNNVDTNTQEFRNHIGDILMELIEDGAMNNNLTYTGGTE